MASSKAVRRLTWTVAGIFSSVAVSGESYRAMTPSNDAVESLGIAWNVVVETGPGSAKASNAGGSLPFADSLSELSILDALNEHRVK